MIPLAMEFDWRPDVYLPGGSGPFPAVLTRVPYGKTAAYCSTPVIAAFPGIRRGDAAVIQDGAAGGDPKSRSNPNPPTNEIGDGYDTLDWISKQPWSDGRTGDVRESYYGCTSWRLRSSGHPALVAIARGDITVDRLKATFRNGALQFDTVGVWAIQLMAQRCQDLSQLDVWHLPRPSSSMLRRSPGAVSTRSCLPAHVAVLGGAQPAGGLRQRAHPGAALRRMVDCYLGATIGN